MILKEIHKARQISFKATNEVETFPLKCVMMWRKDSDPW